MRGAGGFIRCSGGEGCLDEEEEDDCSSGGLDAVR